MAYDPENNPYIPGDPASYDLKWIIDQLNGTIDANEAAAQAQASAEDAAESAEAAAAMAEGWTTPEQFGAKGDGITDDSAAIQAAMDVSLAVKFSKGKTYICHDLMVRTRHDIDLQGATLKTVEDAPIFISDPADDIAVNRVHIYNGNLEGNSTDNTKTNQRLINLCCFYSLFEDLRFNYCYIGLRFRPRTNSSTSTVENVCRELKFNNCYYVSFYIDDTGNATDGRINGLYASCPAGSNSAIFIGQAAGWIIDNIHTYGSADYMVYLKNCSHTFVNNAYIEGNYNYYGLTFASMISSVVLANSIITAFNNGTQMLRAVKSTSAATTLRDLNISNVTLECDVSGITVTPVDGSWDHIYASGLKLNNPHGSIGAIPATLLPAVYGKVSSNHIIYPDNNTSWRVPLYYAKKISNVTTHDIILPEHDGDPWYCTVEIEVSVKKNYTQGTVAWGKYNCMLGYRNGAYYFNGGGNQLSSNMTTLTVTTQTDNIITVTFTTTLANNYGMLTCKIYPFN